MEIQDLLNNVYYGTLRQITEDLVKQIEDHDSFFKGKNKPDEDDIKQKEKLLQVLEPVIRTYCGEGGIPLENSNFELFVLKYFPDMVKDLRLKY
jgi:hypothetical protein